MKSEKLLEAMNELPEEMVEEASVRRRHPLVRIAALAACVAVLLVGMYPFLQSMQRHGGSDEDSSISDIEVIYRQGAIYEVIGTNYADALERLNLPETITEDMIGEKVDVAPDYGDVYSYAPLAGKNGSTPAALYLLNRTDASHEGEWWYLTFSGFTEIGGPNDYVEPDTLLQVYGICSAADIVGITNAETGADFLEPTAFYDALTTASACGWEDFEKLVYGDTAGEEAWLAADEALHEGYMSLRLETEIGLVAHMTYYPSVGYIAWSENYFQVGQLL